MTIKKSLLLFSIAALLAAGCGRQAVDNTPNNSTSLPPSTATGQTPPVAAQQSTLIYKNSQYGFTFALPQTWKGFSVFIKSWTGNDPNSGSSRIDQGPIVYIRNPKWITANPYEDIPIMVFTTSQWDLVQQEKMTVSAAPFGPSELGRNPKYVFALPPRYDYDFATGYREVEQIIAGKPLKGF